MGLKPVQACKEFTQSHLWNGGPSPGGHKRAFHWPLFMSKWRSVGMLALIAGGQHIPVQISFWILFQGLKMVISLWISSKSGGKGHIHETKTKQDAHESHRVSVYKVCVCVCYYVFVCLDKGKKWSHSAREMTFSLAICKSSPYVMNYFSCPQCEWGECLQRHLHNKGSLFLWVDVRPSQQDIFCEDRQSRSFPVSFCSVLSQQFTSKSKLAHSQHDGFLRVSPVYRRKFVFFRVCFCLLAWLSHFLTCLWKSHPSVFLDLCVYVCVWQRDRETIILLACLLSVTCSW